MINCRDCKADCASRGVDRQLDHCGGMIEITNADRIRAMSDEDLAKWLENIVLCATCPVIGSCSVLRVCYGNLLEWLKRPAKEAEIND